MLPLFVEYQLQAQGNTLSRPEASKMLKRFKCPAGSSPSLVIHSKMTVLLQGFGSSPKKEPGSSSGSLLEVGKLLWNQKKQLWFWAPLVLVLVIINSCLIYSTFVKDDSSNPNILDSSNPNPLNSAPVPANSNATSKPSPKLSSSSSNLSLFSNPKPVDNSSSAPAGSCNLSEGRWIPDFTPPLYTNETCKYIQLLQNCMRNGKPDTGYLNWRWKPHNCELPRFDPALFLELLRGKKLLFFGDSLARNHMQSLLCSLSEVEEPEKAYSREDKDVKWRFNSYNFTLAIFWSPFLVKHVKVRDNPLLFNLQLDVPHPAWSSTLADYDFAVVSASQWFFRPSLYSWNNTIIGCNEFSRQNYTDIFFMTAFQKALHTTLRAIGRIDGYRGTTFLRTASPEHFEHGTWSTGGVCNRTTPYDDHHMKELPWLPKTFNEVQTNEYHKFLARGSRNGSKLKVLNVTYSAYLRPDGHPGPYRIYQPFSSSVNVKQQHVQNDCLHWCLPGPVDTWNQILLETMKRS